MGISLFHVRAQRSAANGFHPSPRLPQPSGISGHHAVGLTAAIPYFPVVTGIAASEHLERLRIGIRQFTSAPEHLPVVAGIAVSEKCE